MNSILATRMKRRFLSTHFISSRPHERPAIESMNTIRTVLIRTMDRFNLSKPEVDHEVFIQQWEDVESWKVR
jgi:hypothetical protein